MTALSSATPPTPESMSGAKEPSMEEILASIRRIIADDQSLPSIMGLRGAVEDEPPAPRPAAVQPPMEASAPVHRLHPEPPKRVSEPDAVPAMPSEEPVPTPAVDRAEGLRSFEPPPAPVAPPQQAGPVAVPPPESAGYEPPQVIAAPPQERFQAPEEPVVPRPHVVPSLELPMAHGRIAAPQFASPAGPDALEGDPVPSALVLDVMRQDLEAERVRSALPAEEPAVAESHVEPETPPETAASLFSSETGHSVSSAFNVLAATRLADNSEELMSLAREMIRPLLRAWIDDNLPSMVERLVRAEIERVSRGGR